MTTSAITSHLRRYPLWYAVAAVWLLGIVALPVVQGTALADVFDRGGTEQGAPGPTTAAPSLEPGAPIGPDGTIVAEPDLAVEEPEAADEGDDVVEAAPDQELSLVPPELLDLVFDALPPLVLPALPDEILPIARAVAPLAATGCSAIGLAGVIVAVAAQTAEGVPLERILPYLSPVSTACAAFPIPELHTVCEADKPFITDLAGLTSSPPILGLAIDQLQALEQLLTNQFGVPVPAVSEGLRAQLDCELVR